MVLLTVTDAASNITTATFLRRLGAMLYDGLLLSALLMVAALPVVLIAGANSEFFKSPAYTLYLYVISFLFFGWFWTHGGQTLGMRSWKLQVTCDDGFTLGWDNALIRFLGATLSLCVFGIGFFWILLDSEKLAWHDRLSRTHVLHNPDSGKIPID